MNADPGTIRVTIVVELPEKSYTAVDFVTEPYARQLLRACGVETVHAQSEQAREIPPKD